ncbi:MAG: alanine--tRNA ligase [Candidatus Altiarchaeota archaeon]|nr:alanine--tRNA ligase [Candidatus Altiarchaeota archaeon]
MLTKDVLRKEFAKNWKDYYGVEMFRREGFVRKTCKSCGRAFWTLDQERDICGDSPCKDYEFINNTKTKGKWDYIETWRLFEKFFTKNGHASIPRYPVVDRWRPDLYFTIASIQDFQRLDNGNMNFVYPANPLIVPQVCLRFPDIQNVGVTGKHLTSFIMSGQHAFGYPKTGYFKDRCLELNFEFLSKSMGIPKEELTYHEDIWAMPDFSAFGPCMETFSGGLELVNSVFMQFQKSGDWFRDLDMKVIDVGWGHERLVWFSNGTPASYDSLFGPVTEKLKKAAGAKVEKRIFERYSRIAGSLDLAEIKNIEEAKKQIAKKLGLSLKELRETIEPLQAIYAIVDHSRTLLFAITDGGIPSNVGGGYNLRVILRRALGFIDEFDFDFNLVDIAEMHAKFLKPMFPELVTELESMRKIVDSESQKFKSTKENITRTVQSLIEKNTEFDEKLLTQLYESQGITPEEIKKEKPDLEIPSSFYMNITEKHSSLAEEKETGKVVLDIPETEKLCYLDVFDFVGTIIKIFDSYVVLEKTAFYPTSGGQEHDLGFIGERKVLDVIKQGNIILHKVDSIQGFKEGQKVGCKVDQKRRKQLAQNHSAVHLVNGAARAVLGNHVWQAGSEVREDKARLDITHYKAVTKEELKEIEDLVNEKIAEGIAIEKPVVDRGKAEQDYGFRVYQGGAIPEKDLRIIKIGDFDIEACGGTHCSNTKDLDQVKILRATKIQDGVVRLEFVAGDKAKEQEKKMESLGSEVLKPLEACLSGKSKACSLEEIDEIAAVFSVMPAQLPSTLERFVSEWETAGGNIVKLGGEALESDLSKTSGLKEAAEVLFKEWKQRNKRLKELINERIQDEIKSLPADNPKLRGIFFNLRMNDLQENVDLPVEKTLEKVKRYI